MLQLFGVELRARVVTWPDLGAKRIEFISAFGKRRSSNAEHQADGSRFRSRPGDRHAARNGARLRRGEDRAACRRDRPDRPFSDRVVAGDGAARTARHYRRGRIRRGRNGLSRPLRRDGGGQPRLGFGRAVLRRTLEFVRQPNPPQRQRSTKTKILTEIDFGRACRGSGDERTGGGLRRRLDAAARRPKGRSLDPERHQAVDH